jgi:hypothetical protein
LGGQLETVILACGFGTERPVQGYETKSYWRNEQLGQPMGVVKFGAQRSSPMNRSLAAASKKDDLKIVARSSLSLPFLGAQDQVVLILFAECKGVFSVQEALAGIAPPRFAEVPSFNYETSAVNNGQWQLLRSKEVSELLGIIGAAERNRVCVDHIPGLCQGVDKFLDHD